MVGYTKETMLLFSIFFPSRSLPNVRFCENIRLRQKMRFNIVLNLVKKVGRIGDIEKPPIMTFA